MKNILIIVFLIPIYLLPAQTTSANENDKNKNQKNEIKDELVLPPLDTLFEWAVINSSTLKIQDALIEKTNSDTKRVKKQWLDAFKVNANIRSGSYGNTVVNQIETGYSYGPSISFSLFEILSHQNLVNVYKAEEKIAFYKKKEVAFELRKIITILYNNVITQQKILRIKSDAVNSAYVHVKMADKEFNQGSIALGELSRVTEIYTKAQTELELTINDLKNYYMELEQFCGRTFNNK